MTALMRQLREAMRDPFADPVVIDGCRVPRRLARRFERELRESEAKVAKLRAQLPKSGAVVVGSTRKSPSTDAARSGHEPDPRKRAAPVNVAEPPIGPKCAPCADRPAPEPDPVRKPSVETKAGEAAIVEPVSRPAAGRTAAVRLSPVPPAAGGKIDLSQVPSSMELRAASWKGKP